MSDNYFDLPSRIEDAFAEIDSDIVDEVLIKTVDAPSKSKRVKQKDER